MKTNLFTSSRRRLSLWPQVRSGSPSGGFVRWFFLLALLVTAVTGVKADGYVTDIMVFGAKKGQGNSQVESYTSQHWIKLNKDLNDNAGGWDIFLLYKTSETADPETGYITDIVVSTTKWESGFNYNGRHYEWVPRNSGFNGDLNEEAGGSDIFMYYTRDRANLSTYGGTKRVITDFEWAKKTDTSTNQLNVQWYNCDYSGAADMNKGAGGDDIYIKMNFTTQTLSIKNNPTFFENLIYTGSALNLVSEEATGNYGTMKYRVDGGAWTTNPTATTVGNHTVEYRLDADFANSSSISSGSVNIYPVIQASNLQAEFNQIAKNVTLNWSVGDIPGNYADYQWTVYRGDTKIATLESGVTTYADNGFENEQDINYSVYYIPAPRSVNETYDDAKATATVNTTRSVPVNNMQAVSSENKVTLTWTSVAFPVSANMNNKFDVYIDNTKVATITPATGQTSFKWEHRDDNNAAGRTNYTNKADFSLADIEANIDAYTEEDLDACNLHTYRVVGQIDDTELNSAEQRDKAIGAGTTFENFVCSKGDNQGSVLLTWNVRRLANQSQAETYVIERRVMSQDDNEDSWQKLTTLDSDKTFMTWEDKTPLPGVFYEYRVTVYNYCENGNRPATTAYDTGFALSSGVVSGRITYGTGTAVENVKVTLHQNNDDGETVNHLRSLQFTGTGTGMLCTTTTKDLKKLIGNDFSIQAYVNPNNAQMKGDGTAYVLYDISGLFSILLKYNETAQTYQLGTSIGGVSSFSDVTIPANQWSHVSCVYKKSAHTTTFYITTDADHITSGSITEQTVATATDETGLALGNSVTLDNANNFGGYLDEFRFFKRALTQNDIKKNFNHPMGGTESDLAIYYPMDENMGVQNIVYDFSKSNNTSNGHHATAHVPAVSSGHVPTEEQLSLMSLTDGQGNFVIRGVPFSGEGTNYTVIPTYGIHEFSPSYMSRYVSASSLVHNGVDFEDVSSFPVSGKVRYANTDYPVEDCDINIDGVAASKNGELIKTNADGEFTVSVPIGDHYITIVKDGHTFAAAGRYPADPNKTGMLHTFDQKITGLEFIDETLVNFTGRVVGGSIEGDKPVGFGQSKNNIGVVELVLSPINELYRMNVVKNVTETTSSLDINSEELPVASATSNIKSTSVRGATPDYCKKIYIRTDPSTGEFSAMLPPLQYKVESMKVKKGGLEVGSSTTIDLTQATKVQSDTLTVENGDKQLYDYNLKMVQVYHSTPKFSVTQAGSTDNHFGISKYKVTDDNGTVEINDIYSVGNDGKITYKYGGAVFVKDDTYTFDLNGYEEYTNNDGETPVVSQVPMSGIVVTIDNALSDGQTVYVEDGNVEGRGNVKAGEVVELESNQMQLDDDGHGTYTWSAGLPNITEPYTRTISMTYDIDGRTYQWSGSGMTGIILGEMPTGNNFVTAGPDQLLMILRDPPGSDSSAEWSTGSSITRTTTNGATFSESFQWTNTIKFGFKQATIIGTPATGKVVLTESSNDMTIGVKEEFESEWSNTSSVTTTVTEAVATKGAGDVFIGNATNIIFGKARMLNFKRTNGGVALGLNDIFTTGLQFGTTFNYSQTYIEGTLLPNLKALRNGFLTHVEDTEAAYENNTSRLAYLTTLTEDDEDFGEKGTYKVVKPKNMASDAVYCDSILWANTQIDNWIKYLTLNEEEKVLAYQNRGENVKNESFDSGADVSYSIETEESHVSTWEWNVAAGVFGGDAFGFDFEGLGWDLSFEAEAMGGKHEVHEKEKTDVSSFSYTLSESDDYDALSVDVYNYGAFSPIFRTRGGQTSNPYEGEVRASYYKDDKGNYPVLMEATMQIEVPQIDVEVPVVSDIPSGSAANYVLKLSNASEIGADVTYRLGILDETNPNGAMLTMDGKEIPGLVQGRLIKVPGNQTLTKALQLRQTDTGVLDYENIGVVFASDNEPEDIADTIYITAHFTPSSSAVDLALNNNIMNTQTGTDLKLTFNNFDRNYKNLKAFRVQYKKQGSTDWTLLREYVLDEKNLTENNELLPATGANIDYTLDMNQFTDGDYLFRVLSVATNGTDEVYRSSEEMALVKDMQRPRPLGQPEPADGILSAGDELSVTFNETILKGELTQAANFKVTGVLNGAEVAHETALSMQNTNATAQTEADILLGGKDFSIDAWVNLNGGAGTLLSHGIGNAKMTVGTDATNHLVVKIGSKTYTSDNTVPTESWVFLTLNYRKENDAYKMSATVAKDATETALFVAKDVVAYEGNGPLAVGKNMTGAIHELLLWDEAHDLTTALSQRSRTKNPATRHLIGYWKMDEGEGTTIRDYSRNRHMIMPTETWYMNNANKAVSLTDGNYLSIDASDLPAYGEDDYAVEFWVRGDAQSADAQLLQMGEIGLWVNASGELQFTGKGAYNAANEQTSIAISSGNIMNNAWHHIALNVLRQGAAAVYVDGVRRLSTNAANVGSIATNQLIIGKHRESVASENGVYTYDRPFTGQVDEVRVWNATLNGDKLLSNRKMRLTGSEDGLVAYYPFETKELNECNQVVTTSFADDLARTGHSATVQGGQAAEINFTSDAPALRTKKTETNVPFTFVASNDKVVITIDEEPAKIEGCTLNFTVRDVRDENGNYSLPAVWSAFVNQNQLVWAENTLALEQPQNTTGTIATTIVNKGGQQQMWTLTGMPAWLVPSTESGETNPLAETKVDFTVMPSAPLGRNEVTVYLTGNDNIDVPLTFNIKVNGNKPAWAVNPKDFEGSMNVIGQLYVDGLISEDADDVVAAFIGEECRGVANLQYSPRYDGYFVTMDIYGNSTDNNADINFRAYDASTGTLYPVVNPDVTIKYAELALQGSYANPVKLTTENYIEQQIELRKGWNWISLYVNTGNENMTPSAIFAKVIDDVESVKCHDVYAVKAGESLDGSLETMENGKMYAVKMSNDRTLRLVGQRANITVTLANNWNWVGYGQQLASVTDALANMSPENGDVLKGQQGVAYVDTHEWAGSLLTMQPGKGYQLWSSKAITFSYPNSVTGAAASRMASNLRSQTSDLKSHFAPIDYHLYADNMTITAQVVKDGQVLTDAEIGVFASEECRTAAFTRTDGRAFITVPGDEPCQLTFMVAVDGKVYTARQTIDYAVDARYGSFSQPLFIDLSNATGIEEIVNEKVKMEDAIYDLQGRKINSQLKKGVYVVNGEKKVMK